MGAQLDRLGILQGQRHRLHHECAVTDLNVDRTTHTEGLDRPMKLTSRLACGGMRGPVVADLLDGRKECLGDLRRRGHDGVCGGPTALSQCDAAARVAASGWRWVSVSTATASGVPTADRAASASFRTRIS